MGLRLRFCPLFDKLEESRELILEGGIFCDDGIFTFIYTYIHFNSMFRILSTRWLEIEFVAARLPAGAYWYYYFNYFSIFFVILIFWGLEF